MKFNKIFWTTVALVATMYVIPVKAQEDDYVEFCKGSVNHSLEYMASEELTEVLSAQLKILESDKVGDMEKLVGVAMFLTFQKLSYNFEEFSEKGGTIETFSDTMLNNCIDTMKKYDVVKKPAGSAAGGQTYDSIY